MNRILCLCSALVLAGCGSGDGALDPSYLARQPKEPVVSLANVTALTCHFRAVRSGGLNPGFQKIGANDTLDWTFSALDAGGHSAQAIGKQGASMTSFWIDDFPPGQFVFLETTPGGNRMLTWVFANKPRRGMPAVHSRHTGDGAGGATISQYAGTCDAKW